MRSGRRYGFVLAFAVALLAGAATYTFATMFDSATRARPYLPSEGADTFTVADPRVIRPGRAAYEAFGRSDAAWRARYAPPVAWEALIEGPYVWHPSARQVATDSAYRLEQRGQTSDAIALLGRWVAAHPSDADVLVELARLHNSQGHADSAITRYREALAVRPTQGVRAELAGVLLNNQRLGEAAREYRALLTVEPDHDAYRLGLARALLWGDRGREAERILHALSASAPGDSLLRQMLHAARASYDPSSTVARRWLAEEPRYAPYRLALARALVSEGRPADALAAFDSVLATNATPALLREAAAAHGSARDSTGAARLLGRAVALLPSDDSLRLEYARALSWTGDSPGAIAEYSVLIAHQRSAELLLARGQLYVWSGDYTAGVADLRGSVRLRPTTDAYALLGDVYRWMARYDDAYDMYERALSLQPGNARVLLALSDLRRMEALYVASIMDAESGWVLRGDYAEDNVGFLFLTAGVSRGFQVDDHTVVSVGVEQRRVSQRFHDAPEKYLYGFVAQASARRQLGRRFVVSANAGLARHALVGDMAVGGAALTWIRGRASASLRLATGPVYETLMSMNALVAPGAPAAGGARALIGRTTAASMTVPVGRADLTVTGERLRLSDGNARNLVSASVRVPLAHGVAALYDASTMGYEQPSDLYWDPRRYTAQSVGIEVSGQPAPGVSFAARALPGVARSAEDLGAPAITSPVRPPTETRDVFQLSTSAELEYRTKRWAVTADAGYGRGREGDYQSLNGSLRVRLNW